MSDDYTCKHCYARNCDDRHECEGTPDERIAALVHRIEALEAQTIRNVYKATANPTDTHDGDRLVGYFVDDNDVARAAVKGKSYCGSNGNLRQVAAVVDHEGNVYELMPSRGKLTG